MLDMTLCVCSVPSLLVCIIPYHPTAHSRHTTYNVQRITQGPSPSFFCGRRSLLLCFPRCLAFCCQFLLFLFRQFLFKQSRTCCCRHLLRCVAVLRSRFAGRWSRSDREMLGHLHGDACGTTCPTQHLGIAQHALRHLSADGCFLDRDLVAFIIDHRGSDGCHADSRSISHIRCGRDDQQRLRITVFGNLHLASSQRFASLFRRALLHT
mmetsp:Transcript_7433/g.20104  ORF Transcript_7433/g.20104 Transcript_7433/m.20104 type:complete len:209 (-) Transcript_7433:192-818(-)